MKSLKIASALRLAFYELGYSDINYIEDKIGDITKKIATKKKDMFWEKIKHDFVFPHPETGNKVKYLSLPIEKQRQIRKDYLAKKKEIDKRKKEQAPKSPLTPEIKEKKFKEDKEGQEFLKNKEQREEQVEEVKEEVQSDGFFKKAFKSITNADSYSDFGKAFKNKDKDGMKKALPGMVGGLFKTLAASAVVIGGGGFVGSAGVLTAAKASVVSAASGISAGSVGSGAVGLLGTITSGLVSTASMAFYGALSQKFGLTQAIQKGVEKIPTKKQDLQKKAKKKEEDEKDIDIDKIMENFVKETQKSFVKELDKLKDADHIKKVIKEI